MRRTSAVMTTDMRASRGGIALIRSLTQEDETSAAVVVGAGSSAANGTYEHAGTSNGRPFYTLTGTNPGESAISWNGTDTWNIFSSLGDNLYAATEDVAFPWLVTTWEANDGAAPAPLVFEEGEVPAAVVSGAGTSAANGTYQIAGEINAKPQYSTTGADPQFGSIPAIYWDGSQWLLIGSVGGDSWYVSTDDVAFPWLVTTWALGDIGTNPVPVVTEQ